MVKKLEAIVFQVVNNAKISWMFLRMENRNLFELYVKSLEFNSVL